MHNYVCGIMKLSTEPAAASQNLSHVSSDASEPCIIILLILMCRGRRVTRVDPSYSMLVHGGRQLNISGLFGSGKLLN